ncbi:22858_t:CDS:2 [Entrophospora sp. SA101]|nr:22858_t:CDS:2 [Entrophospora sp. SA101]
MVILIVKGDKPTTPRSNDIPIPYVEVQSVEPETKPTIHEKIVMGKELIKMHSITDLLSKLSVDKEI